MRCSWPRCRQEGTILLCGKEFCDPHHEKVLQSITPEHNLKDRLKSLNSRLRKPKSPTPGDVTPPQGDSECQST